MALVAPDGSWNVTVVDGTALTGVYADDGSFNVVNQTLATAPVGYYHPCGAINVVVAAADGITRMAPQGCLYVSEAASYKKGSQKITVVAGAL